jgi:hypothetical protein
MTCPNCGADYSDSRKADENKRITLGPLDHYGMPYMVSGKACKNCGFVAEVVTKPTGNSFYKREEIKDPAVLFSHHDYHSFIKSLNLIEKFEEFTKQRRMQHGLAANSRS